MEERLEHEGYWELGAADEFGFHFGPDGLGGRMDGSTEVLPKGAFGRGDWSDDIQYTV